MPPPEAALQGITPFERGWLSSNIVLLHGGGEGAVLIDSSHTLHADQTVALLRGALRGERLERIVNTHLHSDHCGGNAAVQRAFGCTITVPPGEFEAVRRWDVEALSYHATGQICERFVPDGVVRPGEVLHVGGRRWQALAAPGHDPHSIVLFDAEHRVLISADALWEHGFGVVFPELDGTEAFADVGRALDLIESLDARWVIPGHGAPFGDVAGALARARQRLAGFVAQPDRHDRHALRVLLKYHLLEMQDEAEASTLDWFDHVPLCRGVWQRMGRPDGSLRAFGQRCVDELVGSGALRRTGDRLLNA